MNIKIDKNSGFCFGVVYAVEKSESYLADNEQLMCLGDIVHNDMEVDRLKTLGLKVIDEKEFRNLKDSTVLFRAHGEPPEMYKIANNNNVTVIDASCPIVLRLQKKIREAYFEMKDRNGQVVIYGKPGHAEVIGLSGHTNNEAIVISSVKDVDKIDFNRPISLFSQTTKSSTGYHQIISIIKSKLKTDDFTFLDSVCRQVSNRDKELKIFCLDKDIIVFLSGKKSSNGKMLYEICKQVNPNTRFVTQINEIKKEWFESYFSVGITGATSTPSWQMVKAKEYIGSFF